MAPKKLAILCDYAEENWPSMDLVAQMLTEQLREHHAHQFDVALLRPPFKRRFGWMPFASAPMVDRLINRLRDYPRWLGKRIDQFDLFHLADHSYSQLVHVLPAERTGVFCHDLDTFRCLLDPASDPRPKLFRAMARRILDGMQKARIVFHATLAVRDEILRHGLIDPARLVHAPLGAAPEFTPGPREEPPAPFILHVGSCIPRKRIDVLLDVFAAIREKRSNLRLIKVGGEWSAAQNDQLKKLHLAEHVEHLHDVNRSDLARLYRAAAVVLIPSQTEGFGLPMLEALACGAPVLASDIPALRQVGADAAVYCPVGDVAQWSLRLDAMLSETDSAPAHSARTSRAAEFSWRRHAEIVAQTYGIFFDWS